MVIVLSVEILTRDDAYPDKDAVVVAALVRTSIVLVFDWFLGHIGQVGP